MAPLQMCDLIWAVQLTTYAAEYTDVLHRAPWRATCA